MKIYHAYIADLSCYNIISLGQTNTLSFFAKDRYDICIILSVAIIGLSFGLGI